MKKSLLILFSLSLIFTPKLWAIGKVDKSKQVTFMSYNIRNGRGMDSQTSLERIAKVINQVSPDVIAVQEVDSVTGRNNVYVLGEIARQSGLIPTYAAAIDYDGGKYGIGILSREKPLSVLRIPLPGREEERILVIAEFKDYFFACAHFSLTPEDQLTTVDIISKELKKLGDKPFFIAGDFNATPQDKPIQMLKNDFEILTDESWHTYIGEEPHMCIDYIMSAKGKGTVHSKSRYLYNDNIASDHQPVVVGVQIMK